MCRASSSNPLTVNHCAQSSGRRATLVRAISDAFRGKFPEVIYAEIAPYMEAPGGDD